LVVLCEAEVYFAMSEVLCYGTTALIGHMSKSS